MLEDEPYNRQANLLLKEAAVAARLAGNRRARACRLCSKKNRATRKSCTSWAGFITTSSESDKAVEIYNRISRSRSRPMREALRLGKDAAARASMKTGGWTQAESYRDLIKDKELAVSLEQQSRMALTGESLDQQIAETYERHAGRAGKRGSRATARRVARTEGRFRERDRLVSIRGGV